MKNLFFVGRNEELQTLRSLWDQREGQLMALMGRRRIGKSRLIQEFAKEADMFFEFQGIAPTKGINNDTQIKIVSDQINSYKKLKKQCSNWSDIFEAINKLITNNKKTIIFLDEISWMAQHDPEFVGRLKIAWDTKFIKNKNLILVICGSVSSWIEENILQRADFIGRINSIIRLSELSLDSAAQFWKQRKQISAFEIYKYLVITGAIPKYLSLMDQRLTAEENIKKLCFTAEGYLFNEFNKIFNDIFNKKSKIYEKLIKTLLNGKKTLPNICRELKVEKNGVVLKHLEDLVHSGFIERDWAYKANGTTGKFSQFRLSDNYVRFYLKYINKNHHKISTQRLNKSLIEHLPQWATVRGLQFENLMLKNLHLILARLNIPTSSIRSASPYFQNKTSKNNGACQIDLLIQSQDEIYYLVEFKYRKYIGPEIIKEIKRKVTVFSRPKYSSVKTILVYCGELAEEIAQSQVFSQIINAAEFLEKS
jgi:AAA+ ATPase superfamily predicted ATPase